MEECRLGDDTWWGGEWRGHNKNSNMAKKPVCKSAEFRNERARNSLNQRLPNPAWLKTQLWHFINL